MLDWDAFRVKLWATTSGTCTYHKHPHHNARLFAEASYYQSMITLSVGRNVSECLFVYFGTWCLQKKIDSKIVKNLPKEIIARAPRTLKCLAAVILAHSDRVLGQTYSYILLVKHLHQLLISPPRITPICTLLYNRRTCTLLHVERREIDSAFLCLHVTRAPSPATHHSDYRCTYTLLYGRHTCSLWYGRHNLHVKCLHQLLIIPPVYICVPLIW